MYIIFKKDKLKIFANYGQSYCVNKKELVLFKKLKMIFLKYVNFFLY